MRSDTFFQLFTISERIAFTRAQRNTGPVETGYARYDKFAQTDAFTLIDGNAVTDCQVANYVRPHARTDCNGHTFPEGALKDSDMKMFGAGIPGHMKRMVNDPERNSELIVHQLSLPNGKTRDVFGFAITDEHKRLLAKQFTGKNHLQERAFDDMVSRVSWVDAETDPLPDLAERVNTFVTSDAEAVTFIGSQGWKVVDPKVKREPFTPFYGVQERGQLYAVPAGDDLLSNSIEADSVQALAGVLKMRDELNFERLATPRPVWGALKALTDEIEKVWYGNPPDALVPFEKAFIAAKYAVRGVDNTSDAWNPTKFDPTDKRIQPYADALLQEMQSERFLQEVPASVLAKRDEMAQVLTATTPSARLS